MKEMVVYNKPKSPVSESYRSIRTNLQFANVDGNLKTILVTSPTAGEGKTTTVGNIALTLADIGSKVLLIDCDLRKPRIHKAFALSNAQGVTDVLLKHLDYKKVIQRGPVKNFDIMTSGKIPSNPSELLYSKSMRELLEKLKEEYDYIFIDTPPVVPVTDAAIMSGYTDGIILVCKSGGVDRELAIQAKESLDKVGANIVGVVLNRIPASDNRYYNYYYYYGEGENKEKKKHNKEK